MNDPFADERQQMVDEQIRARGLSSPRVLAAMTKVPRHQFIPEQSRHLAYTDGPLPIGEDQTISQPYIVALMTDLIDPQPGEKVLEIGTGSGYQAAVLAELEADIYSVEIIESLVRRARATLDQLGYDNVRLKHGDGTQGWAEHAPYDKIIVTAAAQQHIPSALENQLKEGGVMVIPVGAGLQELVKAVKKNGHLVQTSVLPVRFVPLVEHSRKR